MSGSRFSHKGIICSAPFCIGRLLCAVENQSLRSPKIGIYLPKPIFGHGQVYDALSRATTAIGLKVIIGSQPGQPPNTTKNIVYKDFLKKIKMRQVFIICILDI